MSIDEDFPGGHASFMSLSEAAELLGTRENLLEGLSAGRLRSIGVAIRGGDPQASRGAPPIVIPPGTYIGATVIWNEGRVVPAPESIPAEQQSLYERTASCATRSQEFVERARVSPLVFRRCIVGEAPQLI